MFVDCVLCQGNRGKGNDKIVFPFFMFVRRRAEVLGKVLLKIFVRLRQRRSEILKGSAIQGSRVVKWPSDRGVIRRLVLLCH